MNWWQNVNLIDRESNRIWGKSNAVLDRLEEEEKKRRERLGEEQVEVENRMIRRGDPSVQKKWYEIGLQKQEIQAEQQEEALKLREKEQAGVQKEQAALEKKKGRIRGKLYDEEAITIDMSPEEVELYVQERLNRDYAIEARNAGNIEEYLHFEGIADDFLQRAVDYGEEVGTIPKPSGAEAPQGELPWWEKLFTQRVDITNKRAQEQAEAEKEPWYQKKVGPDIIGGAAKGIEAADIPSMMINKYNELLTRDPSSLTEEQSRFVKLYDTESRLPYRATDVQDWISKAGEQSPGAVKILHGLARVAGAAGAQLPFIVYKPSSELKETYYSITGLGEQIGESFRTPLMVGLMATGVGGGATAAFKGLGGAGAKTVAAGGAKTVAARTAQTLLAPVVGFEWVAGKAITLPIKGVSLATNRVLNTALQKNAKRILILSNRDPATLSFAERQLQKILEYHHHWLERKAVEAIKAQKAAGVGAKAPTKETAPGGIKLLDSGIKTTEETVENVIKATAKGDEFTLEMVNKAVVAGTPDDFSKGLVEAMSKVIAEEAGKVPTAVAPKAVEAIPKAAPIVNVSNPEAKLAWDKVYASLPDDIKGKLGNLKSIRVAEFPVEAHGEGGRIIFGGKGDAHIALEVGEPMEDALLHEVLHLYVRENLELVGVKLGSSPFAEEDAVNALMKVIQTGVAPKVVIPKAEAKPEVPVVPTAPTGEQAGMLGVPGKVVTQKGIGKPVTEDMESYLKYQQAMEESKPTEAPKTPEEIWERIGELNEQREFASSKAGEAAGKLEVYGEWRQDPQTKRLMELSDIVRAKEGEVDYIPIAKYRKFMGKDPLQAIVEQHGAHKYVRWEYALDEIATEMGFQGTEGGFELKVAIEQAKLSKSGKKIYRKEIDYYESEVKDIEEQLEKLTVEYDKAVTEPTPSTIAAAFEWAGTDWNTVSSSIERDIVKAESELSGLKGDEAKIAQEGLKGLKEELGYIKKVSSGIEKQPDVAKLRSTIMAWAKFKGLTKSSLQEIFSSVSKHRQLRLVSDEKQLQEILRKVKVARPKRIKGKVVVTPKTEKKITTLKDTLISNKQLTEASYNHLVRQLGIKNVGYKSSYRFMTEGEGKKLIRAMNDEAILAEWDIKVEETIANHPEVKAARDGFNARGGKGNAVIVNGETISISRLNELRSMRYYTLMLQKRMNAPVYDIWQKINMRHLTNQHEQQLGVNKLEASTPNFEAIAKNDAALKRVEDYIAAKHKMGPKSPKDITTEEIKLANELEQQYFQYRNDVRYARFTEAYSGYSGDMDLIATDIPDAPKKSLRRAIDIYEGKGAKELRKFLDTQDWGVVKTGYDPRSFIKPRLYLYSPRATTFAKGHIQTRQGIQYDPEDRNILSRYRSYTKQMMGLTELSPLIRAFDRTFTEHAYKLANYKHVSGVLSRGLNEMKGYKEDGGLIVHGLDRLYAQVAAAVFWRPDLVLRNKFQNWAFNSDFIEAGLLHVTPLELIRACKALDPQQQLWMETFVYQMRGLEQDYLLYSQKPLPGFGRLTDLAHKTSLYPWSDKTNRAEAFLVRMNKVSRALNQYEKDGDINKLIKDSGLNELEPRQQAEALELLVQDSVDYGVSGITPVSGREAFARYNAQQHVNNVHFLYDRAQRAPAEMGATGKTLGNILVFTRSWGERLQLQGRKLGGANVPMGEKIRAAKIIVGVLVAGTLAGEGYKRVTGKSHNPYNPLNILTWSPGGLIVGVANDISSTIYWIVQASQGDEVALGKLPGLISGCNIICLPFYKNTVQAIDSLTDKKNIDLYAMRRIREMIDEEYKLREGAYEVDRNLVEKLQHALLAGKEKEVTEKEKQLDDYAKRFFRVEKFSDLTSDQKKDIREWMERQKK